MTERAIKHEDIQAGDTIRIEWESVDSTHTRTVIVDHRGESGVWRTKRGFVIHAGGKGRAIHLVHRPMKPLPTEPCSVILVTEALGEACHPFYAALHRDGCWLSLPSAHNFHPSSISGWKSVKLVTVEDETE